MTQKDRLYTNTTVREAMSRMSDAMTSFDEMAVSVPKLQFDLKSVYPISQIRDLVSGINGGNVTKQDLPRLDLPAERTNNELV